MGDLSELPPMKPMEEVPSILERAPSDLPEISDPAIIFYLPRWHWGACVFPFYWSLSHNLPGYALVSFLLGGWLPGVPFMGFVMGMLGYRLAWESRGPRDYVQLRARERAWSFVGICWLLALVLLAVLGLTMSALT